MNTEDTNIGKSVDKTRPKTQKNNIIDDEEQDAQHTKTRYGTWCFGRVSSSCFLEDTCVLLVARSLIANCKLQMQLRGSFQFTHYMQTMQKCYYRNLEATVITNYNSFKKCLKVAIY